MPKKVRTALGEEIDFDMIRLKQQIAEAPMNIEVQRRKEFIDNKEGKARGSRVASSSVVEEAVEIASQTSPTASDFEVEGDPTPTKRK